MKKSPCKDCPDRHVGCHAHCAKYAEFDQECEKIRKARAVEQDIDCLTLDRFNAKRDMWIKRCKARGKRVW